MTSSSRQPMDKSLAEAVALHKQGQFELAFKALSASFSTAIRRIPTR